MLKTRCAKCDKTRDMKVLAVDEPLKSANLPSRVVVECTNCKQVQYVVNE